MAEKISSVLIDAAAKLTRLNKSSASMRKTQSSYTEFLRFMDVETNNLKAIKFDKKKLNKLPTINVTSTFGDTGNLLNSLFSGALDLGGFIGDIVGGGKKKPNAPAAPTARTPKPIPKGNRIRLPNIRGLGVLSALFAAVDFAGGLQEGESPAKAATGAAGSAVGGIGGALAGAAIAGAIGQTFVPIPGLGFVLGAALSSLGAFGGGYAADRAYETVTGEGQTKEKDLEKKLKEQEKKQKEVSAIRGIEATSKTLMDDVLNKFDKVVSNFEDMIGRMFATGFNAAASMTGSDERMYDYGLNPESLPDTELTISGELQDMTAEGGKLPSNYVTSGYGWRWQRLHSGVDYAISEGTPVSIIQPGKVTYARFNDGGYGKSVEVTHPGGIKTFYAHLNSINVSEGQEVSPGTVIGTVGSTGRSTGPHVHFEVLSGGRPIPIKKDEGNKYFRFGGNVKVKPKNQNTVSPPPAPTQIANQQPKVSAQPNNRLDQSLQRQQSQSTSQTNSQVKPTTNTVRTPSIQPVQNSYYVPNVIQQYQQYPTYNQTQSMTTLIPIIPPQNASSPVIVSSGSGGGGVTIIPGPSEGEVVNALMKTMLLTNLSST